MSFRKDSYKFIAPYYEKLVAFFSAGNIKASKEEIGRYIDVDHHVLHVGAGAGEELVFSLAKAKRVTVLENSPAMLAECRKKIAGSNVELILDDILSHRRYLTYDVIICSYVLNVFTYSKMKEVLTCLKQLLKQDALLIIVDVSLVRETGLKKLVQWVYWYGAILIFRILTKNPIHPIYDYQKECEKLGLKLVDRHLFNITSLGPELATLVFKLFAFFVIYPA